MRTKHALVILTGLLFGLSVFAEVQNPTTKDPVISADKAQVKGDRTQLKKDKKEFGKDSSQVKSDKEKLATDKAKLRADRKAKHTIQK